jgi:hypothetical protein
MMDDDEQDGSREQPRHGGVVPTLAPDGLYGLPIENLSDEIPVTDADAPPPKRRGPFRRMLDQLLGRGEPPARV